MRIFSLVLFSIFSLNVYSQNKTLYIFDNRYHTSIAELNKKTSYDLKALKILLQHNIDPSNKGNIRYDLIDAFLNKSYPDKNVSGMLCIDYEGKYFNEIRDNSSNSKQFKNAVNEFVQIIRYIKNKLPNVEVGIYGMPYRGFNEAQLKKNDNAKLDVLLKEIDVLMPSLYIAYPAKQKGTQFNVEYLRKNMDIALEYGVRLNKSVIPFFWYFVHPGNKTYGYEFIPKDELYIYFNYVNNYNFKGKVVNGVVWWDTPTPYNKKIFKNNLLKNAKKINSIDESFGYYLFK